MRFRLAAPTVLVDIGRLTELATVNDGGDYVSIGGLTTHHSVQNNALLQAEAPLLAHVAGRVGDPQVRHKGTLGGSLAHGDPASDLPAAILAMGATIVVQGTGGSREIAATDFFTGFLETALAPEEIITEVRVPKMAGAGWSFQKFNRRAQDWAIVGVAAVSNGSSSVALINMGQTPMRASAVEAALAGGASAADAAALAAEGTSPPEDLNGDGAYRSHLARVLVKRALAEADA
ncbi:UNVERIFIED_CONTAM: hypothetical protein GTU68_025768 [Idotea baltica]|nr:hypothetical protein [Idotea baltica]